MYSDTRFQQVLKALPAALTTRLAAQTDAARYDKHFGPREHVIAMLYGQFSGAMSLRELVAGLNAHTAQHYHLGIGAIRRSTLADANGRRPVAFFKALAEHLMDRAKRHHRRELVELVQLLDSTPIQLKGRGFDWTQVNPTSRTCGLKVHMMIDAAAHRPVYLNITDPNVNDITDARDMALVAGVMYVMDKGYCDYSWWHAIDAAGSRFVTRFKRNAGVTVQKQRTAEGESIQEDTEVTFTHRSNRAKHHNPYYGKTLRRIRVTREGKAPLVLATNDLDTPAADLAMLYKRRWQIELFFKWIKQHLKIKRFLGRSRNAVSVQIYVAIIGYLLLWLHHSRHGQLATSLHLFLAELKATLFQRIETQQQRVYRQRRQETRRLIAEMQAVLPL